MAISKIGSRAIIDGSVLAADFAPGTITNAKLAGSIPNDQLANSTITIGGEAISLGGSDNALNLIDWQSKVTSDGSTVTTMVAGRGYFVDNSSAAGIVKLPASATIGQQIAIKDYAGNFGTNNLTIQRNSHNIQGVAADSTISTNRASLILVYVDSTKGWLFTDEHNVADLQSPLHTEATGGTVTTSGDFKVHIFTGDGNFVVSQLGNAPVIPAGGPTNVDYLVVAGGGGAGGVSHSAFGAAGGAGGYRTSYPSPGCNAGAFPISATTFPISVGAGGAGGGGGAPTPQPNGTNGSNSIFSTITSAGGGGGGTATANGNAGGSGGGGGVGNSGPLGSGAGSGGAGNTPPVSPSQGNPGGSGASTSGSGGGGGAGGAGGNAPGNNAGGAAGIGANIADAFIGPSAPSYGTPGPAGSTRYFSGGGGGYGQLTQGNGGAGGGGNGLAFGPPAFVPATSGTVNTGGGSGGGSSTGTGGSGIVIIRYKYQ